MRAFVLPHASDYALRVLAVAGVYALLALGYLFIFGHAGALSLAQGAFMGVGAYVSGILAVRYGIGFDTALPASVGLPAMLALLVAIPVLRLQTHYFALATLLIAQIVLLIATQWESVTGGANGIGGVPPPSLLGRTLDGRLAQLVLVWGFVAVGALFAWQVLRGRLGDAFAMARLHPAAARAVGIDTGRLRLTAFLLSAAYAGLAGSLYVHAVGVLSPDVLGFPVMVTCLTIAVVGSRLRVAGAIAGAVLITELPEWARFLRDDYLLAFGIVLLLVVVVSARRPGGDGRAWPRPGLDRAARTASGPRHRRPVAAARALAAGDRGAEPLLRRRPGARRRFARSARRRGARPDRSQRLGQDDAAERRDRHLSARRRPRALGRPRHRAACAACHRPSRHRADVPDPCARARPVGARQCRRRPPGRACRPADRPERRPARCRPRRRTGRGLGAARPDGGGVVRRRSRARTLPPGIARLVEIARALATAPRLLLLDEPAAGLNETEQADLAQRLRGLAEQGIALLVIEHNMPFLAPLADRLICLDQGKVIAAGLPAEVQSDPLVIAAYLGTPAESVS